MRHYYQKQIKIGRVTTSETEIRDLIKAWLAISAAFAVLLGGPVLSSKFYSAFVISSLTVGIGFLLHELGHKFAAQRYGCFAEFRSFDVMLVLAVIMSFFGFVFAAPGAVMISGPVGVRRNGKISLAGPLVNIALAAIFLAALLVVKNPLASSISFYGYTVNSWLALFNMLPFWNFDGAKILRWSKLAFGIAVAASFALMLAQGFLMGK